MNRWRTRCQVCKRYVIIESEKLLPHPNVSNTGRCSGSGSPHPKFRRDIASGRGGKAGE